MKIFNTTGDIQNYLADKKNIAFVPTMGGLHLGHLSLIDIAKKNADIVVVSIFLNPTQFGKNEDLYTYPQDLESDIELLKSKKVDVLFAPNVDEIYPKNYHFSYKIGYLNTILCSKTRPHFFAGVTQVVYRLFDIIKPSVAVFGKKDYQQLLVIKQMVKDFNLDINILSGEIIREVQGLALSTRNKYLNTNEYNIANKINEFLQQAKSEILQKTQISIVKNNLITHLRKYFTLDYCEFLNAKNLCKIDNSTKNIIILVAVKLGSTRLIDNIEINNLKIVGEKNV